MVGRRRYAARAPSDPSTQMSAVSLLELASCTFARVEPQTTWWLRTSDRHCCRRCSTDRVWHDAKGTAGQRTIPRPAPSRQSTGAGGRAPYSPSQPRCQPRCPTPVGRHQLPQGSYTLCVTNRIYCAHGAGAGWFSFRVQAQRATRRGNQTISAVQLAAMGAGGGAMTSRGVTPRGRRGGRGSSGGAAVRLVDADVVAGAAGAAGAGQVGKASLSLVHVAPGGPRGCSTPVAAAT